MLINQRHARAVTELLNKLNYAREAFLILSYVSRTSVLIFPVAALHAAADTESTETGGSSAIFTKPEETFVIPRIGPEDKRVSINSP